MRLHCRTWYSPPRSSVAAMEIAMERLIDGGGCEAPCVEVVRRTNHFTTGRRIRRFENEVSHTRPDRGVRLHWRLYSRRSSKYAAASFHSRYLASKDSGQDA